MNTAILDLTRCLMPAVSIIIHTRPPSLSPVFFSFSPIVHILIAVVEAGIAIASAVMIWLKVLDSPSTALLSFSIVA